MKYKVGDKVLIKSLLVEGNFYGEHSVNEDMLKFCNKICTISQVDKDHYVLKEDPDSWWWTDEMIDGKISYVAEQFIKENKENIKMANTDLIQNKLEKELEALDKARLKEIKDEFYKTSIGKAAKAFNEALQELYMDEYHRSFRIDEEQLISLEQQRYVAEINEHYNAKREEVREYYREAIGLFENADTYEQKHEILTSYGILKGPKPIKVKVEGCRNDLYL